MSDLKNLVNETLEKQQCDTVRFKQWKSTDRSTLEEVELDVEDFVDNLTEKYIHLTEHHFIAEHQSKFFKQKKASLRSNEAVIVLDFAENYAAQGFHWNNSQVTIHPIVIYFKNPDNLELHHHNFAMISDHYVHDTNAVYSFQKIAMKEIQKQLPFISKVFYFSDGSSA